MPDIPTVAETLPNFRGFPAWWAFFGPTGLPAPIAETLERRKCAAALSSPKFVAKLAIWDSPPSEARPKSSRRTSSAKSTPLGPWPRRSALEPE